MRLIKAGFIHAFQAVEWLRPDAPDADDAPLHHSSHVALRGRRATARGRMARTLARWCVAAFVAIACGPSRSDPLTSGTGTTWIVDLDPQYQTARYASPRQPVTLPSAPDAHSAILSFLEQYKGSFGFEDPASDFRFEAQSTDDWGLQHLRFSQQTRAAEVLGGEWLATLDDQGRVVAMAGSFIPGTDAVDVAPMQTAAAVLSAVESSGAASAASIASMQVDPSPVVQALDTTHRALVYVVHGNGQRIFVDARTGAIVSSVSTLMTAQAMGYGAVHYPPFRDGSAAPVSFPVSDTMPWVLDVVTATGASSRHAWARW